MVLFLGGEVLFAHAAELAGKIIGKVFPLHTGLVLVIDPAADVANILHVLFLLVGFQTPSPVRVLYHPPVRFAR